MGVTNESTTTLLDLVAALLPSCEESDGPCYSETAGMGYVVYDSNYKMCLHSFITTPGFSLLPHWFLGVLYVLLTCYLFLGVAIASDIFMESVETITASTKTVTRKLSDGREVTVEEPVWNWVVANISLMALGTSSPEIVLALMDCVLELGKAEGSQLGPSTIVGSGSFNLLVITAACTLSISNGAYKRIAQLRVYIYTTIFQFWAHIWMLIVYRFWTPDIISLEEALITLIQFPILVLGAWLVDTQPWARNKVGAEKGDAEMGKQGMEASMLGTPRANEGKGALQKEPAMPLSARGQRGTLNYQRRAARAITGNMTRLRTSFLIREENTVADEDDSSSANMLVTMTQLASARQKVLFKSSAYSVLESTGVARVSVIRYDGNMDTVLRIKYSTVENTAVGGLDFEPTSGILTFERGEDTKVVNINIVDDDLSEPDVSFFVQLATCDDDGSDVTIIQDKVMVTIVDDDQNGMLSFELPHYEASSSEAMVKVVRQLGSDGTVMVAFHTSDGTATAGADYAFSDGTLVFEPGQVEQFVRVPILKFAALGVHKTFKLSLDTPDGGAELGKRITCRVTIIKRFELKSGKGDLASAEEVKPKEEGEKGQTVYETYAEQFAAAVSVPECEGGADWSSLTMHYCSITWKLIFAVIPSPIYAGGYACFFVSLLMLGLVVFLLVASTHMLGCLFMLKPLVNGYTIVALGTSLPDLFASRIAAMSDVTADAAIGSVMGSNSVNVFLGLGLPWLVGVLYSIAKKTEYSQPGGDLFFSVLVFCCVAALGVVVMMFCRYKGGELGGPAIIRVSSALIYLALWVLFIILSGMRAYNDI